MNAMNEMNWSEFFSMGGYAFYVWGSYLVTFVTLGGEIFLVLRRKKLLERNRTSNKEYQA